MKAMIGIAVLSALVISGCATRQEVVKFSEAGIVYTNAMDTLVGAAEVAEVDQTTFALAAEDFKPGGLDRQTYSALSDQSAETLRELSLFRDHNRLLARYFLALRELGTSDAPAAAGERTSAIVEQLGGIATTFLASPGPFAQSVASALGGVVTFAMEISVWSRLSDEIANNGPLIENHLALHAAALAVIARSVQDNREAIANDVRLFLARDPLLARGRLGPADLQTVLEARRATVLGVPESADIEAAREALEKLRAAFATVRERGLSEARIEAMFAAAEEFSGAVGALVD